MKHLNPTIFKLQKFNQITKRVKILSIIACFLLVLVGVEYTVLRPSPVVNAAGADDFVTTWHVEAGAPGGLTVKLPLSQHYVGQGSYCANIDWGDGTSPTTGSGATNYEHTYTADGDYQIRIEGENCFPAMTLNNDLNNLTELETNIAADQLRQINQWGNIKWQDMSYMFYNATELVGSYIDQPDLSQVTDMSNMFRNAYSFNSPVDFDTSNVTNMAGMFMNTQSFNQPVNFDTSNVTNMNSMFSRAGAFNQPVNFDTVNVIDMTAMFSNTQVFNQPVNFDTSNVTDMTFMFNNARAFNQLINFDTTNVTTMRAMFLGAPVFNSSVNFIDTSNVVDMSLLFANTPVFNQPLNFDTVNVTDMTAMFSGATSFNSPINFSDTSNVGNMSQMFQNAQAFNQPINFDTSGVVDLRAMFRNAWEFNQPVNFDTSHVVNMSAMFHHAHKFNQSVNFDTSRVTNMRNMFYQAHDFNQDISNFDFSNVTNIDNFISLTDMSIANNDALIQRWYDQLRTVSNLRPISLDLYYFDAEAERDYLINTMGWEFQDTKANNYPVINDQTFAIDENSANGAVVGQVVASDPDAGQSLTYSIVSGNDLGIFALSSDGQITVADNTNLDYEQHTSVSLVVRVTDNGTPIASSDATITININDVNEAPVINDQTFVIDENSANGTVVGQVVASDIDAGQTLTYSIVSGNGLGIFAISADGEITVADNTNLDYEQHTSVDLVVRVTDNGTPALNNQATVTINLNDINEAPIFTSVASVSLDHDETLTHILTAIDPESDSLTFSADSLPSWISLTGDQLEIAPSYANIGTHTVEVKVSDGVNETIQDLIIIVREANIAPVIDDQTFSVDENSANGTVVGQVVASDQNTSQTLTYEIVSGNNLGIFTLSDSGQITVADNTNLDYEQHTSVSLVIRALDNGVPILSSEAVITINILDVNENPVDNNSSTNNTSIKPPSTGYKMTSKDELLIVGVIITLVVGLLYIQQRETIIS